MILTCHTNWTNELGYTWKQGERIEWLWCHIASRNCTVREPKQKQAFEIKYEIIQSNFK